MLPQVLVGAYRQYKEDTDSVATWLASTARMYGYQSKFSSVDQSEEKFDGERIPGRLKGKVRKETKKKDIAAESNVNPKYKVAIADYVPMAEYIIASQNPVITVPGSFMIVLDRVIRLRSSFSSRMSKHGVKRDADADSTHTHFVGVLQKVREVIQPRVQSTVHNNTTEVSEKQTIQGFEALRVYEPSQEFLNAPDIPRPQKTSNDKTVYEAEMTDTLEDALIMWHLVMGDADKIRNQIRWAWQGFLDGDFDLTAAAIMTDVGIHMARDLVDQSSELFDKNGGILEISKIYFAQTAAEQGFIQEDISACSVNGDENSSLHALYDKTFCQALHLIQPLIHMNAFGGHFSPASILRKVHGCGTAQLLTVRFWFETVLFTCHRRSFPVADEYLHSVLEAGSTNKISFRLAFANQIRLDIHHLFGQDSTKGFNILKTHIGSMVSQGDSFIDALSKPGTTVFTPEVRKHIETCKEYLRSIL
ncbi:hypothetical protein ACHAPU_001078 [Fusarium lateritium]